MNKLIKLRQMGFSIPWKLILMGRHFPEAAPEPLGRAEIVTYLMTLLEGSADPALEAQAISLLCAAEDGDAFDRQLQRLAQDDPADEALQRRKWCAYFLAQILEAEIQDPVQGLLELLFFWCNIGCSARCPHDLMEKLSPETFFCDSNYQHVLAQNRVWLQKEIAEILLQEGRSTATVRGRSAAVRKREFYE